MPSKPATYADLLALPEDVRAEVIAGEVVSSPAALPRHSNVQGAMRSFLGRPFHDDLRDAARPPNELLVDRNADLLGWHSIVPPQVGQRCNPSACIAGIELEGLRFDALQELELNGTIGAELQQGVCLICD